MSPSDHTSAAGLMGTPGVTCSGAIQSGVPSIDCVAWRALASASMRATPKSMIFTMKLAPRWRGRASSTFSGLRSRCTMLARWAAPSAWQSWPRISRTSRSGSAPRCSTWAPSSSPSSSSITIHGAPLFASTPEAMTSTT